MVLIHRHTLAELQSLADIYISPSKNVPASIHHVFVTLP